MIVGIFLQYTYVPHALYPRSPLPHCSTDEEDPGGRSPPFEVSEGEEDNDGHPGTSSTLSGELQTKKVLRPSPRQYFHGLGLVMDSSGLDYNTVA